MESNIIKENDFIFLVLDDRRRWLVQVKKGEEFHTHKGIISHSDLIGKAFGTCIFSKPHESQGYKFYILKPYPSDFILHMARKTQIIYPKDAGIILLHTGIGPGCKVIEAGCGSGALTCILGNYVRPNGHIFSYDIREKSLKQATKNIKKANLNDYVSINYGNILEDDLNHKNIDAIVLDMPTPWLAIEKVKKYLKLSGSIVSFSPTIEQVKKTTFEMEKNDFFEIISVELLIREMQIKENATRPNTRMIGHSGYLTFGRKIENKKNPYRGIKPRKKEFINLDGMPLRDIDDNEK
ncbi:MAG: tRNA (adenine-N1)-methyltransferase [Candidatus Lokiarchaeota archaeon]|nr:tRNA (adenine-N1)-methyltransferase [Candidatus Lokiarchaeota archaeon]